MLVFEFLLVWCEGCLWGIIGYFDLLVFGVCGLFFDLRLGLLVVFVVAVVLFVWVCS